MFDEPVKGIIDTELVAEQGQINVQVDGTVSARDIHQWSNQVLMTQMEGLLGYNVNVHIPFGGDAAPIWVEATSDLVGVHVDLPAPLGKPVDSYRNCTEIHRIPLLSLRGTPRAILMHFQDSPPLEHNSSPQERGLARLWA